MPWRSARRPSKSPVLGEENDNKRTLDDLSISESSNEPKAPRIVGSPNNDDTDEEIKENKQEARTTDERWSATMVATLAGKAAKSVNSSSKKKGNSSKTRSN